MLYDPQSWSLPPSAQRVTNAGANRGHCHWACKGLRMLCNPSRVHHLWVRRGWPVLRDLYSVLFSLDGHRSASAVQPSNEVIAFERVGGGVANASQHLIRVIFWSLLNAVRPYIQLTTTTTNSHVLECCASVLSGSLQFCAQECKCCAGLTNNISEKIHGKTTTTEYC